MQKRKKSAKRRRRGRFAIVYKLLSVFLVSGAAITALTLFFRVENIEIKGNTRYTDQQVIAATGISMGDNLYLLNKFTIKDDIFAELPYVGAVTIYRQLPSTLVIQVTEQEAAAVCLSEGQGWLINSGGKILGKTDGMEQEGIPTIEGVKLLAPAEGEVLVLSQEDQFRQTKLLELLQAAERTELLSHLTRINLADPQVVELRYEQRFTVKMNWESEAEGRLKRLQYVIDHLEVNETGVIDMTEEGVTRFIPQA